MTAPSSMTTMRSLMAMTVHVVLDDEDGRAAGRPQVDDVLQQLDRQRRRDPGHRFVEEDHAWSGHQGTAELQQLALTAGERAGVVTGKAAEADQVEQFARLLANLALAPRQTPRPVERRSQLLLPVHAGQHHVLQHRHAGQHPRDLEGAHQAGRGQRVGRPAVAAPAVEMDRAALRGRKPEMRLNIVVLPAPLGPMSPVIEPDATSNEASLTATTPPNRLLTPPSTGSLRRHRSNNPAVAQEPLGTDRHEEDQQQPDEDQAQVGAIPESNSESG